VTDHYLLVKYFLFTVCFNLFCGSLEIYFFFFYYYTFSGLLDMMFWSYLDLGIKFLWERNLADLTVLVQKNFETSFRISNLFFVFLILFFSRLTKTKFQEMKSLVVALGHSISNII